MTHDELRSWLDTYGRAWETRDPELVVTLFTQDATYQETPFVKPMRGRAAIHEYWAQKVVQLQEDVRFGHEVLAVETDTGIAHWWVSFVRIRTKSKVKLDGIFLLTFDRTRHCRTLREWWVKQES
jgi:uncharacterized protein (TIGR02246 family)